MAGFFDFIKKPQSGTVTPVPADTAGAPVQTQTTQVVTQEEVVTHGGGSYNGIGNPPGGQAYNGIGNPPTPQIPQTTETVTTTQTTPTVPSQVPTAPTDAASAQPETINNTTNNKDATKETKNVAENAQKDQTKKEAVDQKAGETKNGDTPKVAGGPAALQSTIDQKKREELDLMTHLTQRSNRVFLSAQNKAKELNGELVDSEHLLHGLLSDSEIYKLFSDLKIYPQVIEQELAKVYKKGATPVKTVQLAPRVKMILGNSLVIARKLGFEFVSPEHILIALYEEGEGVAAQILAKLGLKKEDINKKVTGKKEGVLNTDTKVEERGKSMIGQFTIDLTAKAAQGQLDPVVERSEVIERVIHILSRRSKNNPALVGEAGVGKTAIVEGLAEKIVSKQVPDPLLDKKILQLDLMSVLAGASHRGEFEERMKNLVEEVQNSKGQIILFIDELHNIVGAGSSGDGSMDASNFLKPALARGEIQLIGATTLTEYRKYIEKDPALERRFQPVVVPEPTEEQAMKMLQATKDKYEAFHRVKIPDLAIEAAVKLSKRYVGDRFLPDKAVDLIDEAASAVRLPLISLPEEIRSLEERVSQLKQEQTEAEKTGDRVKARILKSKLDDREHTLTEKKDEYNMKKGQTTSEVTIEIIKDIVSRWTGIPVSKITGSEMEKLANLEKIMHERLIDQEAAVSVIAQAVRRGRAGLKSTQRPIGSFVFLGPTGVGKTELAKTLAEILFGQEEAMIRFDMTEYMEKHEVAKLLGAPPGYVGYEEGGKLTEAVRRRPYAVVLFDEVEKAHPDIFNILLQILDDGRLTDNKGHVVSFKNTVVICTSNIGTQVIQDEMLKSGKGEVEEPPVVSSYAFSPSGREMLTIGPKYFLRTMPKSNTATVKQAQDKAPTDDKKMQTDDAKPKVDWKEGMLLDYFAENILNTPKVTTENNQDQQKVDFPTMGFDTQAISAKGIASSAPQVSTYAYSPRGREILTLKDSYFERDGEQVDVKQTQSPNKSTWKKTAVADYFAGQIIENKTSTDQPQAQPPTAKVEFPKEFDTHAMSTEGIEMLTKGENVYYRTSTTAKVWSTSTLIEYFKDNVVINALPDAPDEQLPTARLDTHAFSLDDMEYVTFSDRYWKRKKNSIDWETGKLKDYYVTQSAEKGTLPVTKWQVHTFAPTGKEVIIADNTVWFKNADETVWHMQTLLDYFGNDSPFVQKQSNSEEGMEMITKGNTVFYRQTTTSRSWDTKSLNDYFKDHKVINSLPDMPEEQLPVARLRTHAYSPEGVELITFKDRYWKRNGDTKEWETGYLKDYFTDQVVDKNNFPTTHWDIHTYSPGGLEIIIVGDVIWYRDGTEKTWQTKTLKDYFGEDFPLEKEIEEKKKVDEELDRKKYDVVKDKVMLELRKFFRPELINRFDEVIVFEPLKFIHMMAIVKLQLKGVGKLLEDQDMGFIYTEAAVKEIVRAGFDPVYGARPLRRAIQKLIENPISTLIIEKKVGVGDQIMVDFDGDNFVFNIEKVELVVPTEAKPEEVKSFLCETCGATFKTQVLSTATVVCSKCASQHVQEVTEEKKDAEPKSEVGKETETKDADNKDVKEEPKVEDKNTVKKEAAISSEPVQEKSDSKPKETVPPESPDKT